MQAGKALSGTKAGAPAAHSAPGPARAPRTARLDAPRTEHRSIFSSAQRLRLREIFIGYDLFALAGLRSDSLRLSTFRFDAPPLSVVSAQQAPKREVLIQVRPVNAIR
jgi:hypothetical protein